MHQHDGEKGSGMMWMMMLCCALPLLLLLGGGGISSGGYLLPILVGILIFVHLWMMFRDHSKKD